MFEKTIPWYIKPLLVFKKKKYGLDPDLHESPMLVYKQLFGKNYILHRAWWEEIVGLSK